MYLIQKVKIFYVKRLAMKNPSFQSMPLSCSHSLPTFLLYKLIFFSTVVTVYPSTGAHWRNLFVY